MTAGRHRLAIMVALSLPVACSSALAQAGGAPDEGELLAALEGDNYAVKVKAIDHLVERCSTRALPAMARILAREARGIDFKINMSRTTEVEEFFHRIVDCNLKGSVDTLAQALRNPDPDLRGQAARWLGEIGPKARSAAPRIKELLDDELDCVRVEAATALWHLEGRSDSIIALLIELLEKDERCIDGLLRAIITMREDALDAIGALVGRIYRDPRRGGLRYDIALAAMGTPALESIRSLAKDRDSTVREIAVEALERLGEASAPAVRSLLPLVSDPDRVVAVRAVRALAKLKVSSDEIEASLARALTRTTDLNLKADIVRTLGELRARSGGALKAVFDSLKSTDQDLRFAAINALGSMGCTATAALPPLGDLLAHRDSSVRIMAARTIGRFEGVQILLGHLGRRRKFHREDDLGGSRSFRVPAPL